MTNETKSDHEPADLRAVRPYLMVGSASVYDPFGLTWWLVEVLR